MSRKHTEKCGCIVDASDRYVQMCPAHEEEWRATRERWRQERDAPFEVQIHYINGKEVPPGVQSLPTIDTAQA